MYQLFHTYLHCIFVFSDLYLLPNCTFVFLVPLYRWFPLSAPFQIGGIQQWLPEHRCKLSIGEHLCTLISIGGNLTLIIMIHIMIHVIIIRIHVMIHTIITSSSTSSISLIKDLSLLLGELVHSSHYFLALSRHLPKLLISQPAKLLSQPS